MTEHSDMLAQFGVSGGPRIALEWPWSDIWVGLQWPYSGPRITLEWPQSDHEVARVSEKCHVGPVGVSCGGSSTSRPPPPHWLQWGQHSTGFRFDRLMLHSGQRLVVWCVILSSSVLIKNAELDRMTNHTTNPKSEHSNYKLEKRRNVGSLCLETKDILLSISFLYRSVVSNYYLCQHLFHPTSIEFLTKSERKCFIVNQINKVSRVFR